MDEPNDILEGDNSSAFINTFVQDLEQSDLDDVSRIFDVALGVEPADDEPGRPEGGDARSEASWLGASAKSKPSPQPSSLQFDSNINVSHVSIHWSRFVCSIFGRMDFGPMYLQMKVLCRQIFLKV